MNRWARAFFSLAITAALVNLGCKPVASKSQLQNVFKEDIASQERRREALAVEAAWTVFLRGCSGTLLNPSLVLTAAHCAVKSGDILTSGIRKLSDDLPDLVVDSVLENDTNLDYSLVRVSWTRKASSNQTYPPFIANDKKAIFASQLEGLGDAIFSVGFPQDKTGTWKVTYADGQLKIADAYEVKYNVSVINGNSGGGILRKEDSRLLAIVLSGSKSYGERGWDESKLTNASGWNGGLPLWVIYEKSQRVREAFPSGRNAKLQSDDLPSSQLFVKLATKDDEIGLTVSSTHLTAAVLLCPKGAFPCTKKSTGVKLLDFKGYLNGRRIYEANVSASRTKDMGLVAIDAEGQTIVRRRMELVSP